MTIASHRRSTKRLRPLAATLALSAVLAFTVAPVAGFAQQVDRYGNDMGAQYAGQPYNEPNATTAYSFSLGEDCGLLNVGYSCNANTKYFKCRPKDGGATCQDISPAKQQPATPEPEQILPNLSIPIPDLTFSNAVIATQDGQAGIQINWIAQWIQAVYRFGIGVATVLAAVMMMIGGIQWLTAGGDASKVSAAKEKISDAVMGLALSLGVFLILSLINPDILNLNSLFVSKVPADTVDSPFSGTMTGANAANCAEAVKAAQAAKCAFAEGIVPASPGSSLACNYHFSTLNYDYTKINMVDYTGNWGSVITAPINGTVKYTKADGICGNSIRVINSNGYITICHAKDFIGEDGKQLANGTAVTQGTPLGHVGGRCCSGETVPSSWTHPNAGSWCHFDGRACNDPSSAESCECQTSAQSGQTSGPHLHLTYRGSTGYLLSCIKQ